MSRCSYCHRELPDWKHFCQQCFEARYDELSDSKPWRQRFQLRPQFTWDNFIGFGLLFTVSFAALRFDSPYFHARHMRTTETSALISTLIACVAFFQRGRDKSQFVASPSNVPEHKMDWRRFTLLVVAEAVVGLLLYALFTLIPVALQMLITVASWVIVEIETWIFRKTRASVPLSAITSVVGLLCWLAWRTTHEQVWSRVGLVGGCLMAGLIFLDRRQEWLDS